MHALVIVAVEGPPAGLKTHEVMHGNRLIDAQTWPDEDGFRYSALDGTVSGFTRGTRHEALRDLRQDLRELRGQPRGTW